jgi:hypothetical protein
MLFLFTREIERPAPFGAGLFLLGLFSSRQDPNT